MCALSLVGDLNGKISFYSHNRFKERKNNLYKFYCSKMHLYCFTSVYCLHKSNNSEYENNIFKYFHLVA